MTRVICRCLPERTRLVQSIPSRSHCGLPQEDIQGTYRSKFIFQHLISKCVSGLKIQRLIASDFPKNALWSLLIKIMPCWPFWPASRNLRDVLRALRETVHFGFVSWSIVQ